MPYAVCKLIVLTNPHAEKKKLAIKAILGKFEYELDIRQYYGIRCDNDWSCDSVGESSSKVS